MALVRPPWSDDPEVRAFFESLAFEHESPTGTTFRVGTIGSALGRGSTAVLTDLDGNEITVEGYLVSTGKQIPSGARCAAMKYKTKWYVIQSDQCYEDAP